MNLDLSPDTGRMNGRWRAGKNYLFAGSDEGGRRAAIIYTLIETARPNDVDPEAWLGNVISRTAHHPNTKIDELLPWKWSGAGSQAIAA
jgi:hypothetical protein